MIQQQLWLLECVLNRLFFFLLSRWQLFGSGRLCKPLHPFGNNRELLSVVGPFASAPPPVDAGPHDSRCCTVRMSPVFFFFSSTHLVLQPPLASHLSCYCKKCKKEFLKLIINYIYMQHWGKKEKNNKRRRSFFFCLCFCAWLHRHSCFIRECGPRPTLHPPHHLCTD